MKFQEKKTEINLWAGEKKRKPEMKSVFVVLCDACVVIFVGETSP